MRSVLVLIKNSRETSQMLEMKHVYVLFFHEFILMLKPATQIKDGTDYFTRILWCLCLRKELPSFYCSEFPFVRNTTNVCGQNCSRVHLTPVSASSILGCC